MKLKQFEEVHLTEKGAYGKEYENDFQRDLMMKKQTSCEIAIQRFCSICLILPIFTAQNLFILLSFQ